MLLVVVKIAFFFIRLSIYIMNIVVGNANLLENLKSLHSNHLHKSPFGICCEKRFLSFPHSHPQKSARVSNIGTKKTKMLKAYSEILPFHCERWFDIVFEIVWEKY